MKTRILLGLTTLLTLVSACGANQASAPQSSQSGEGGQPEAVAMEALVTGVRHKPNCRPPGTLSVLPTSPQPSATQLLLSADADCIAAFGTEYRFRYRATRHGGFGPWVELRSWGASTFSFDTTGLAAGRYWISAQSRPRFWPLQVSERTLVFELTPARPPRPVISSFTASPPVITAGNSSTLNWVVTGATTVFIDQGIGWVTGHTSLVVDTWNTEIYTLTIRNAVGDFATATATVNVVPPASIASFSADPTTIAVGRSSTLAASFTNGVAKIDNGIGNVISGVGISAGPLSASTTYTLTVTNPAGDSATATATVSVVPPGTFISTGAMTSARFWHTATLLPNGKVLIAGGGALADGIAPSTAELYDPSVGTFTVTGSPTTPGGAATALPDGKVLFVHGSTAELYDPSSGAFAGTGSKNTLSSGSATLLLNGKVLVFGDRGEVPSSCKAAELYDPSTGTFTVTGSAGTWRGWPTATLLANGMVFVPGGYGAIADDLCAIGGETLATSELYDPSTGTFAATGSMPMRLYQHTATLLANGMVLVAGGDTNEIGGQIPSYAYLYDPTTGKFGWASSMTAGRAGHTATLLSSGKVLVTGGYTGDSFWDILSTAELYDPRTGTFAATGSMRISRQGHTATSLSNGRVLITGGLGSSESSAELYLY